MIFRECHRAALTWCLIIVSLGRRYKLSDHAPIVMGPEKKSPAEAGLRTRFLSISLLIAARRLLRRRLVRRSSLARRVLLSGRIIPLSRGRCCALARLTGSRRLSRRLVLRHRLVLLLRRRLPSPLTCRGLARRSLAGALTGCRLRLALARCGRLVLA